MMPFIQTIPLRDRIKTVAGLVIPGLSVYATGERDMQLTFGKIYPSVYILKQNSQSTTPGGSSHVFRQTFDCYIQIACVAARFEDGVVEGEIARRDLCTAVVDAVHGWIAPGMDLAFDLSNYTDGDPADTVNYGVLRFHSRALYQKATTP